MLLIYLIFREFFTVIAIFQHNFVLHEEFPEVHKFFNGKSDAF